MTTFQFPPPTPQPPPVQGVAGNYGSLGYILPGPYGPSSASQVGSIPAPQVQPPPRVSTGLPGFGQAGAAPSAPAAQATQAAAQGAASPASKSMAYRFGKNLGGGVRWLGGALGNLGKLSQLSRTSLTGEAMTDIAAGAGMGATSAKWLSRGGRAGAAALLGYGAYKGGKSLYDAMHDDSVPAPQAAGPQLSKEEAQMRQKVSDTVLRGLKFDDKTKFSKTDMQALLRGQPASVKGLYDSLRQSTAIQGKKYSQFDKDVYDAARGEKSVLDIYNSIKRASMGGEGGDKLPDVIYLPRRYKLGESGKEYMVAIDAKTEKGKPRMVYMALDDNKLSFEKPE